jgi:putative endonuclease
MGEERRRHLGQVGEQLAADHLARRGYRILERNYRTRWGELDIVAFDGRTLVFCEVKTRQVRSRTLAQSPGSLPPVEGVTRRKREQVRKMAGRWLSERRDHPYAALLRFDAIGIRLDAADGLVSLDHLEDAF